MAKLSNVEITSLLLADQGSDPATPSAGFKRLYGKSAGLYLVNSAGTVVQFLSAAGGTFTGDISVPDEAYGVGWNASLEVPTKNAVYDKIETLGSGAIRVEDEGVSTVAAATGINFAGAGVTVTDAGSNEALVTIPGAAGASVATMYRSTNQTGVADATWTDVDWSTEMFDDASLADVTTNQFTAPATGRYRLTGGVELVAAGAITFLRAYKNGTTVVGYSGGLASAATYDTQRMLIDTGWKTCSASDTFKVQAFSDVASGTTTITGDAAGGSTWTTFEFIAD